MKKPFITLNLPKFLRRVPKPKPNKPRREHEDKERGEHRRPGHVQRGK